MGAPLKTQKRPIYRCLLTPSGGLILKGVWFFQLFLVPYDCLTTKRHSLWYIKTFQLFNRSPLSPQEGQEGARPLWTPSPFVKEGRPRDRGCSNGVVL